MARTTESVLTLCRGRGRRRLRGRLDLRLSLLLLLLLLLLDNGSAHLLGLLNVAQEHV
jgi:hypothetical protein